MKREEEEEEEEEEAHHKLLHTQGESSGVKQNLPLFGEEAQYLFHHDHKVLRQEFVCLWDTKTSKDTH